MGEFLLVVGISFIIICVPILTCHFMPSKDRYEDR